MKESDGIVGTQARALKDLVEKSQQEQCRTAREQAELKAREIRRNARRQARERVGKAVGEERARMQQEVRVVEAEIETEQRRRSRRRDMELIASGTGMLKEALMKRWDDEDGRREWARVALEEAAEVLLGRDWTLEHPAAWAEAERDEATKWADEQYGATLALKPAEDLERGLRIRNRGAIVDMSIAGLTADTRSIHGALLATVRRADARRGDADTGQGQGQGQGQGRDKGQADERRANNGEAS